MTGVAVSGSTPAGGYDWGVADSKKLATRWNSVAEREFGDRLARARTAASRLPDNWLEETERAALAEWLERKAQILLGRIPPIYRDARPHHDLTNRWLAAYRAGRRHNYVIAGPPRVGKTWEAAALARTLLVEDSIPVLMVETAELLAALRPGLDGMTDIGQYQVTPVLVLDDLGAERPTDWTGEQLYRLFQYRHNRNLPVIVTTNLGTAGLQQHCGERVYRRLVDNAGLLSIEAAPPQASKAFGADL